MERLLFECAVRSLLIAACTAAALSVMRVKNARDQATAGFLAPPPGIPAERQPAIATDPAGPSIFTAIQEQLGLKLDPGRGPGRFLVVDRIERPSEN